MTESAIREEVCRVNRSLMENGLVAAYSGNASGLRPESGIVFIKPSGVPYDTLSPEDIVAVELETGRHAEGQKKPSVDLPHHLFLYRNLPGIGGIVHTHSRFATAFAALGRPIPCVLTQIADVFGGDVPCAPYADNVGENLGRSILRHKTERSPAILLAHHGVFAWGESPTAALKAAIMVEDAARTVFTAMQIGDPQRLTTEEIEKWWDRYQHRYGQV